MGGFETCNPYVDLGPTQEHLRRKLTTIMESVSRVCEDAMEDHERVTELAVTLKEKEILVALYYDLDVPCVIQGGLLWFSSPSRGKTMKAVNMAIVATFTMLFEDCTRHERVC